MEQITEDYVSFEVAKLLNEKGYYGGLPKLHMFPTSKKHFKAAGLQVTQALVVKWLRVNFNWNVEIGYRNSHKDFNAQIYPIFPNTSVQSAGKYKTHEEATEAAILYCLQNLN